jgi:hypothetical protein
MALTPQEQAVLEELQRRAAEKPPRTETGIAGLLHTLIDVASGAVAHLGPERWGELHDQAEALGTQEAVNADAAERSLAAEEPAGPAVPQETVGGTEGTGFAG